MFVGLPGGDFVEQGLHDLESGSETVEALLVAIGGPRLRRLGFDIPTITSPLYALLTLQSTDGSRAVHPNRARALSISDHRSRDIQASSRADFRGNPT